MSHTIKIKRSELAGAVPTASDLATHEIAMNVNDGKIYTKNSVGSIVVVANKVEDAQTESDVLALAIALG
jgi:hypothetical protein